jgi:hypothetical protein
MNFMHEAQSLFGRTDLQIKNLEQIRIIGVSAADETKTELIGTLIRVVLARSPTIFWKTIHLQLSNTEEVSKTISNPNSGHWIVLISGEITQVDWLESLGGVALRVMGDGDSKGPYKTIVLAERQVDTHTLAEKLHVALTSVLVSPQ